MDMFHMPRLADDEIATWPPRELGGTFVLKPAIVPIRGTVPVSRRPRTRSRDGERIRNGLVGLAMAFRRLREVLE